MKDNKGLYRTRNLKHPNTYPHQNQSYKVVFKRPACYFSEFCASKTYNTPYVVLAQDILFCYTCTEVLLQLTLFCSLFKHGWNFSFNRHCSSLYYGSHTAQLEGCDKSHQVLSVNSESQLWISEATPRFLELTGRKGTHTRST